MLIQDRKSVVQGKSVDLGGRRILNSLIQRVLTPDWAQKNALHYFAQWASRGSYFLSVHSYTTAIISPYLSGSFTKVGCARGILAFPTLPLPETEEQLMISEDVSDAISRTVPICSQTIRSQGIVNDIYDGVIDKDRCKLEYVFQAQVYVFG